MRLSELSMRTGRLNDKESKNFVNNNASVWLTDGKIIGQIDRFNLRRYEDMYSLWNDSNYVASAKLSDYGNYSEVNLLHVDEKYRNQKILSKLLWNFKTRQGKNKLILNQYHSDDLYDVIKNGGLSKFEKYWIDGNGNKESFDTSSIEKYYSRLKPTGWKLVLENDGNFSDMPHFTEGKNWITEDYSWQIE
jgi:hypothetical protein